MPPRRRAETPVANRAMERDMRELCVRLDAMETKKRRVPDVGDVSEAENEELEVEEAIAEDFAEERLLRAVVKTLIQKEMFTGLFEGATSNRATLCYNNLQARVFIPSTLIYTKYVYQEKHLEEDPSRRGSFY
jgi:hypothetical protein